ncbi:MAG: hypothetical protein AAF525_09815 [Pseudomonadota bacterium]
MTLRQRRRHSELMAQFEKMKKDPYLQPPADYEVGSDPEEDKKYEAAFSAMNALLEEIHQLEETAREDN